MEVDLLATRQPTVLFVSGDVTHGGSEWERLGETILERNQKEMN